MGETATADRLEAWRDLIRDHFVALDIAADRRDAFRGQVRSAGLGALDLATVVSGPQTFTRTARLARSDGEVYLQVGLLTRGAAVVAQDGREAVLGPGDFVLYESDRPFRWAMTREWELLVLTWPRACVRVPDTVSRELTAHRLDGGTGLGAIVGRVLRDLVAAPPDLSADGRVRLGDEVLDLVTTVAGERARPPEPDRPGEALLRRVDGYIREHVADPGLGPAAIAAAHYVSTRHLHRLFAARGTTVTRQVQQLRLERARLDLRRPGDRSITDIACAWGFADLATFSRAFRAAYGTTPSRYRAGHAG
ncbi:helix-turn-helix domain-containing protein [Geodermatophilus sp. FMUSA9-8]|uniref:AraC-like ligand-binding domain-containing protein n=1 Tax=Geodermatophilus sp. FMUSA9-8 TaxID=3120155 RepID=UPI00300A0A6C